jgi:hypothetical protein
MISQYYYVMHQLGIVRHTSQFWLIEDSMSIVSIWNDILEYILNRYKTCLTVFICNALARYCTAWSSISLHDRSNVVSVYVEWKWYDSHRMHYPSVERFQRWFCYIENWTLSASIIINDAESVINQLKNFYSVDL